MAPPSGPWAVDDLLRCLPAVGLAIVAVVAGWFAASDESLLQDQLAASYVCVGGLFIGGYANLVWLLRGRRAIGERRRQLLGDGERRLVEPATVDTAVDSTLISGPGLVRFHRASCALVAGRTWQGSSREEHLRSDRRACGVCRP